MPVSRPQGNGALAAGVHDIRVFKATEADFNGGDPIPNYVTFFGFSAESSAAGAGPTAVTTEPGVALPARKIEFLGDSMYTPPSMTMTPPAHHPR